MRKSQKPVYRSGSERKRLVQSLLNWFAVHQRDLPWRRSRDPYRIWVSEVMLQQTRVEAVRPYYERWFERFPTPADLAAAPEDDVLKAWEGLGYYSRARNLQSAVREVVARYGGEIPDDAEAVRALPGVGPYTAGAILSIAYNRPEPAVDGNVLRVLSRLYAIGDDIMKPATRAGMEALARELIPAGQAGAFNQALMELGALICTPSSPKCNACPVSAVCQARAQGLTAALPVRAKARAPRPVDVVTGIVRRGDGRVLIARRPADGLLGGLWEFPGGERAPDTPWEHALHAVLQKRFGMEVEVEAHLADVKHTFTHLVWNLRAFTCLAREVPGEAGVTGGVTEGAQELVPGVGQARPRERTLGDSRGGGRSQDGEVRWVAPAELGAYAFPGAHTRLVALVMGTGTHKPLPPALPNG